MRDEEQYANLTPEARLDWFVTEIDAYFCAISETSRLDVAVATSSRLISEMTGVDVAVANSRRLSRPGGALVPCSSRASRLGLATPFRAGRVRFRLANQGKARRT